MHDRGDEIDGRLGRILAERLRPAVHTRLAPLALAVWHVPPGSDGAVGEPVPFARARDAAYAEARVGDRWGPAWGTSWFHLTGEVPADAGPAEIVLDLGWSTRRPGFQAEGLVLRPDGTPVKGLNPLNSWIPVLPGAPVDLYVEAAANPTIGPATGRTREGDRTTASPDPLYTVSRAEICSLDTDVFELVADLDVLDQLRRALPRHDARGRQVLLAIEAAIDTLDLADVGGTAAAARAVLAPVLAERSGQDGRGVHKISAVGHAHIDAAWLWPVRETVRKVARTVANVTHLMDTDDSLVYCMSSAQQWEWLRIDQPALFARVREHVATGRFVPTGGMWVESDTNMVGGEAMARQFVAGKSWFLEHLGIESEEVWLPDSFGYTAALPQIVRLAGFRWFLTQKISWNTVNVFPHHTFWWEGIDGTRVFTHFPPADTYNGTLAGTELARSAANFRDTGAASHALIPFGFGDGGGGPTREMLGRAKRSADLLGSPRVTVESPAAFFTQAEAEYADEAPVWSGELYLEIHRGTYTSQARTKQGNRRCEHLLREAELWCATAAVRTGLRYPAESLRDAWRTVLLNQFHDILPGSAIAWVHREAAAAHARVAAELSGLIEGALAALAEGGTEQVSFNAGPLPRRGAPALGADLTSTAAPVTASGGDTLENDLLRVRVDEAGVIRSILDKRADREVLPPGGAAGLLQLHPDHPVKWDAWDLDSSYRHRVTDLTDVRELRVDPGGIQVVRAFGDSTVTQRFGLDGARVLVECEVDWHEREKVLKLAVDCDVHTDQARAETQFGHVVRPTHVNTSWDAARFEVCAHRWVQVADAGYGVALANAASYGHDVTRHPRKGGGTFSRMRATLLRAPRFPDPETDQGRHVLAFAIVPGADVAGAAAAGYALNLPLRERVGRRVEPLVTVEGTAYVEAVKLAEDGTGDVVVRLYEPLGARSDVSLTPAFTTGPGRVVDLLERDLDDGTGWDGRHLRLRPFQIVTLRFPRPVATASR